MIPHSLQFCSGRYSVAGLSQYIHVSVAATAASSPQSVLGGVSGAARGSRSGRPEGATDGSGDEVRRDLVGARRPPLLRQRIET